MTKKRIVIVDGLSEDDFLDAFKIRKNPQHCVPFSIIEDGKTVETEFCIHTISSYDKVQKRLGGAGNDWFFIGYIEMIPSVRPGMRLRGRYSTKTKTGWVEVLSQEAADNISRIIIQGK
ncbi:MAG: hypothetical protein WC827_03375 [Candidatus Paceibacterota bacterium]|jgi:hypothetical protein